jgi:hypothetical protein
MSHSTNPYQSPFAADLIVQAEVVDDQALWRKGNLLVMHKMALLPDRCVKSNVPVKRRLKRSLSWHHPAIFLALLINLIVYVILALILRKTATIQIGLSDEWFAKRHRAILIGWTSVIGSIGMVIAGIAMNRSGASGWLIVAGVVLFLVGAIYGLLGARMVAPTRISDTHIWLKGVCPEFLAGLPEWPGSP